MGGALTAARNKTITWQTPIQAGDRIELEFSDDGLEWYPANNFVSSSGAGPANYLITTSGVNSGATLRQDTSTTTIISFNRYLFVLPDGTGPGNWNSSWRWRVMKAKAGAAVGFGAATSERMGLVSREFKDASTTTLTVGDWSGSANTLTASAWTFHRTGNKGLFTFRVQIATTVNAYSNFSITLPAVVGTPAVPSGASFAQTGMATYGTSTGNINVGEIAAVIYNTGKIYILTNASTSRAHVRGSIELTYD
jgi:hypothetical protein